MNIKEYLKLSGVTQAEFADELGVTQGFIGQLVRNERPIPATKVIAIEKATNGIVSRYDLRPDVFPIEN